MPTPEAQNHDPRDRWNRRFGERGPADFGLEPSSWLSNHRCLLARQPRGPALDLAGGNGRNSFWLAELGFSVELLDISDVAVAWVRDEARRRDLPISTRRVDLLETEIEPERYHVALDFYFLERDLLPAIARSLAPGGVLVFETFCRLPQAPLPEGRCGVIPDRFVLQPDELRRAFAELELIDYREAVIETAGGSRRPVASLVARRP